jgi:hypothetical protein
MKKMKKSMTLIAAMVLLFSANGCFVVGHAVGADKADKIDSKRPIIKPDLNIINQLKPGTWVEIARISKKKTVDGSYVEAENLVEANGDIVPVIKLKMKGKRATQMIRLRDIDHIVIGHKSKGPIILGTGLGLIVDAVAVAGAIIILKAIIASIIE